MTRYTLAGSWKAEPDPDGEFVLWRDVRETVTTAADLAAERDRFYRALGRISLGSDEASRMAKRVLRNVQ